MRDYRLERKESVNNEKKLCSTQLIMINNDKEKSKTERSFMADNDTTNEEQWFTEYRYLTEDDVYTQLALKDKDLALAKDIGEALLAENKELREKYENLIDTHDVQLQELKQKEHEYKRKSDQNASLQDEKIQELQTDLENLQNKLQSLERSARNESETRKQNAIDLVEENGKLTSQLSKVNASNKQLLIEIRRKERMQKARNCCDSCSLCDKSKESESLRQKISILQEERSLLDTSINNLAEDKKEYNKEVNRLTQKVILLTEELAESKSELSLCEEEFNTSKKENIKLNDQLEEIKLQSSQHLALSGSSIFSEISMLENEADFSMKLAESPCYKRIRQVGSLQGTPKPLAASSSINLLKSNLTPVKISLDESIQSSEDEESFEEKTDESVLKQQGYFAQLEEEQKTNYELRKEMFAVCHQMIQACKLVSNNNNYESKQTLNMKLEDHFMEDEFIAGTLTMISAELIGLIKEYVERQSNKTETESLLNETKLSSLEKQVEDLTTECFEAKKQLSSLGIQLEQSRNKTSQQESEIQKLLEKTRVQEKEITKLKNTRNISRLSGSQSIVDELEKAKLDVKNLDNQLLVAINQKIKLSEQLEQWQYDMASVIEEQVQKQLKNSFNERQNAQRRSSMPRLSFMKKGWNFTG